jgi:hypothetical protein
MTDKHGRVNGRLAKLILKLEARLYNTDGEVRLSVRDAREALLALREMRERAPATWRRLNTPPSK